MGAHLWCTCPRCHGEKWFEVDQYVDAHAGVKLRGSEVTIGADEELPTTLIYVGETDDESYQMEVLVTVYPSEGTAEVAYRRNKFDTWGPPTVVYEEDAEVHVISSRRRHPSAQS